MAFVLVAKWTANEARVTASGAARPSSLALSRRARVPLLPALPRPREPGTPSSSSRSTTTRRPSRRTARRSTSSKSPSARRSRSAREPRPDVLRDDLSRTSPARAAREPFLPMLALRLSRNDCGPARCAGPSAVVRWVLRVGGRVRRLCRSWRLCWSRWLCCGRHCLRGCSRAPELVQPVLHLEQPDDPADQRDESPQAGQTRDRLRLTGLCVHVPDV